MSGTFSPLLRTLQIPIQELQSTSRVSLSFPVSHFVPVKLSAMSFIHFNFVRGANLAESVRFLKPANAVLTLRFKRSLIQFPQ